MGGHGSIGGYFQQVTLLQNLQSMEFGLRVLMQ
jgi:hypothetical protein